MYAVLLRLQWLGDKALHINSNSESFYYMLISLLNFIIIFALLQFLISLYTFQSSPQYVNNQNGCVAAQLATQPIRSIIGSTLYSMQITNRQKFVALSSLVYLPTV